MPDFKDRKLDLRGIHDLGLTEAELKGIRTGLPKLLGAPEQALPSDVNVADLVGQLEPIVDSQEAYVNSRKIGRRRFLWQTGAIAAVGSGVAIGYFQSDNILNLWDQYWAWEDQKRANQLQAEAAKTAEELRKRQEQEAIAQRIKREKDIHLENNKQLDSSGTTLSKTNMRVRYPAAINNVVYGAPVENQAFFEIPSGREIVFKTGGGNEVKTSINISEFQRPSDGVIVPKLTVIKPDIVKASSQENPSQTVPDIDEWVLRSQKTPGLETGVVIIEKIEDQKITPWMFRIGRSTTNSSVVFQFSSMTRLYLPSDSQK